MKKDLEGKNIALFIDNTRKKKRVENIYDFALKLNEIKIRANGLKNIEKIYSDISANMMNRFLSVLKVHPMVQELVKQRKIDNINAIYYMHTLPPEDQIYLSNLLVMGKINSIDIRTLRPLKKRFPKADIKTLIKKVIKSKDIKNYLIKFDNVRKNDIVAIEGRLSALIDKHEFKINIKNKIGTITLSSMGLKKIRLVAKTRNVNLKELMKAIINNK